MLTLRVTSKRHSNVVVVTVRKTKDHEVGSEVARGSKGASTNCGHECSPRAPQLKGKEELLEGVLCSAPIHTTQKHTYAHK